MPIVPAVLASPGVQRASTAPTAVVPASASSPAGKMQAGGSERSSPARRPPRRRKPSPEELEATFRELEAFKREEERRKKDADKQQRQQSIQDKRNLTRAMQQAQREANARQAEVDRLLRQLEKVEHEQERQASRKNAQQERLDDALRKLREEKYSVELQYEGKLSEAGEARGRLNEIESVIAVKQVEDKVEDDASDSSEDGIERAQQELLKADMSQLRTRIHFLSSDNGRLRQELAELRRAVAVRRPKVGAPFGSASYVALPQQTILSGPSRNIVSNIAVPVVSATVPLGGSRSMGALPIGAGTPVWSSPSRSPPRSPQLGGSSMVLPVQPMAALQGPPFFKSAPLAFATPTTPGSLPSLLRAPSPQAAVSKGSNSGDE